MKEKMNNLGERFGKSNWLILLLFGTIGQLAWTVENMYFNLFVYETIAPDLDTVTLMVQLSGIVATVATLVAGVFSDKLGNRRSFISIGYIIWGISVALFGCLSPSLTSALFGVGAQRAIAVTLVLVVVGDCVMTLFGSAANDAAFNAWVTDNTRPAYRGSVEGVLSILPLIAMLIVAGGFGIIKDIIGYRSLFIALGAIISLVGVFGVFSIKDSERLEKNGGFRDILYGFKPSSIKENIPFYTALLIVLIYGIAAQIFMPYIIIFMTTYLHFSVIEYSIAFGGAILAGAALNLYLTRLSDRKSKISMLYLATAIFSLGLFAMYFASMIEEKTALLIVFTAAGFVMITGYILVTALCGSVVRDNTPAHAVGRLQGVRMVFSVLIPMLAGPAIGNAINAGMNIELVNPGADAMTTRYIPAPEIFLAGAITALLIFALIPLLKKVTDKNSK
ncbi:MAG: MFS transporter [Clostridia bacterium]|nr:MFS transporter [Clostridia bacterium]